MIAYIKGKLVHKDPTFAIIEANGIGYHIHISLNTFSEIKDKENTQLITHFQVREDAHLLFGFATASEKRIFQHLISVNGVGPSTAIVVLSYLSPSEVRTAILQENVSALQAVKGIGGKTAQRIILELKDKMKKDPEEGTIEAISHNTIRQEALTALITLGIGKPAAEKSVEKVLKTSGSTISLEELIKESLRNA